jgi:hypothetical protein
MPIILVDWSDVREQLRIMTLRASISIQGRSVTVYEPTFLFEDYNAPRSHNAFLAELANVLPQGCCPLIVTDAGYRNTWFSNKSLYPKANSTAKYISNVQLARKSPLSCHLHLFKAKPKLRKNKRSSKAGRNHTAQNHESI